MKFGRLFWKVFFGNAVLVAAVLLVFSWLLIRQMDRFYLAELTSTLRFQAETLAHLTESQFAARSADDLERVAREIAAHEAAGIRVTFIDPTGVVLGDSESPPTEMESHRDRVEVRQAAIDGWGEDTRLSQTLGRPMKYVAVRVGPPENPLGYVRLAMALREIGRHSSNIRHLLWTTGLASLAASILLALGLARLWSKPIRQITRTARNLSRGDLSARLPVRGRDELAELGRSLNEMRDHLVTHLETIDGQRRTLQSLLTQLREGVIVTRGDGHIGLINPAATRLLGLSGPPEDFVGRPLEACVTSHRLQKILQRADRQGESAIHEVQINVHGESSLRSLLASVSDIRLEIMGERTSGRLLVLTDITPLARMIQVKADFAANASHELRTPLATIRAAVETLASIEPSEQSAGFRRYLDIIDRQSSRMEALVRDLLDLSRIESEKASTETGLVALPILLADLHERYRDRIEAKGLHWSVGLPDDLGPLQLNTRLLRLVLDNLVDNAVKFTGAGGHISVTARADGRDGSRSIQIEVADDGCGIPQEDQERVFERFYQVERSRSGAERGTGLGLSIVRHAVSALGGSVQLRSSPGQGTAVTLDLPASVQEQEAAR